MSEPKTVLIVDDDRDACALLGEWLRGQGHRVIEATDGLDGLEQLHEWRGRVDAVILDLEMPTLDGASFRVHQLHYPALRDVPVIVSSGHPHAAEIAQEVDAIAMVPKPVSPPVMQAALEKAFGLARAEE
jgi:chemotaxis family two-component system sensor histidine kinase/response regulator PixL